jgi:chromosome segregation ATPase
VKPKPKTRAMLVAELEQLRTDFVALRTERDGAARHAQDLRTKVDEVKERLAFAEAELQRMHGYIQRVQEDDVVREELITVGDPEAEQRMVPKRKPTPFAGVSAAARHDCAEAPHFPGRSLRDFECRERKRHWVTY